MPSPNPIVSVESAAPESATPESATPKRPTPVVADWLAVDWGTSRLRVWGMDAAGEVIAEKHNDNGATNLQQDMFESCLLETAAELLADGRKTPALICGMAGARNRWQETPYLPVPCSPLELGAQTVEVPVRDGRLSAHILCGLSQDAPCDVMRGEETQLVGLLSRQANFSGVVCLPGTHTKWVRVEDGKITGFTTLMSGEIYHLFSKVSVLRRSVETDEWDEDSFIAAVANTLANPSTAAATLFSIRAESLLRGLSKSAARARLSGYWIGLELAATREYWSAGEVIIIGENILCQQYQTALAKQQVKTKTIFATEMTLAGLRFLYPMLKEKLK